MKKTTILAVALVSLAGGVFGTIQLVQRGIVSVTFAPSVPTTAAPSPTPPIPSSPPSEVIVGVPPDALERMHLGFGQVRQEAVSANLRVPGTVQANAYQEVRVTSLVGGVATEVSGELGQTVKRGQPLAFLFSRELAEAQAEFVGMQSELEADHKKLVRTQELLDHGAVSRQQLESVEASHKVHAAHLEEARQRLLLLGRSEAQVEEVRAGGTVSSSIAVSAPIDGVVTVRSLNTGQAVSVGQELFTVTDLSSVWVEGNVLEDNLGTITKGAVVTMSTPAYPRRKYHGLVDYVDPRVDPQTRTAKMRVVVENRDRALRLGMYVDMDFVNTAGVAIVVPVQAIQMIGSASVVYVPVADEPGHFRQTTVVPGTLTGAQRQITGDIKPGQSVVTEGGFLLRSEALRQHPQ